MELDEGQQRIVDQVGGPLRVGGGFGSGKSAALRARARRLLDEGRRPLLVHHRDLVALAVEILGRHGRPDTLLRPDEQRAVVSDLIQPTDRPHVDDVVATITAFQASFLGDEELRVHADAAGVLDRAEVLIALTGRYLRALAGRGAVDSGGALVSASLLLRDPAVLDAERARFDELLVDDFQLATFATNRLVTQLVGPGGPVVVAGDAAAAVSSQPLASASHLERFARRFDATTITLEGDHRSPGVPTLRIVDDAEGSRAAIREVVAGARTQGIDAGATAIVTPELVEAAVGRDWPLVIVPEATEGTWPRRRPREPWFDRELFHGPDVPDDDERDRRWIELERRRFAVATSRATRWLVVTAHDPFSRFLGDLVGS